jgi:Leucine-rich repeat (LRR) protein
MPIKRISEELVSEIVANYPDLTVLNLSNNELEEIQNLSLLSSLTSLNISGNLILVCCLLELRGYRCTYLRIAGPVQS